MIEYHDKAVEDFSAVIKKNPKNAHAYFRRAFSYKSTKVSSIKSLTNFSNLKKLPMILSKLKVYLL